MKSLIRDIQPIIIRGGGDLATGTIFRLYKAGFPVIVLESERPSAIRRSVSFGQAVYDGTVCVEGVTAILVGTPEEALEMAYRQTERLKETCGGSRGGACDGKQEPPIPVLVDPDCTFPAVYCRLTGHRPRVMIDGVMAKRNLGTTIGMAELVIALGPGFYADATGEDPGADCHYVIETMRGHDLGRVIATGPALPNTGIPGSIAGVGKERVMHAPAAGRFHALHAIGDRVRAGDVLAELQPEPGAEDRTPVPLYASIDGVLRGILQEGYPAHKGLKAADIDPRVEEQKNCYTISDKARTIAGSVLELVVRRYLTDLYV